MYSGNRRIRSVCVLFALMLVLSLHRGCSAVRSSLQLLTVRVSTVDDDRPVSGAKVYRLYESQNGVRGDTYTTGTNGFAEIEERSYVPCPRVNCDLAVLEEFVTGTTGTFVVDDDVLADTLELELQVGNIVMGNVYSLEVISISEPVWER